VGVLVAVGAAAWCVGGERRIGCRRSRCVRWERVGVSVGSGVGCRWGVAYLVAVGVGLECPSEWRIVCSRQRRGCVGGQRVLVAVGGREVLVAVGGSGVGVSVGSGVLLP